MISSCKLKHIHQGTPCFLAYSPQQSRKMVTQIYRKRSKDTERRKFKEFLDTLVCAVDIADSTRILRFASSSVSFPRSVSTVMSPRAERCASNGQDLSPFPGLDRWIRDLVKRWPRDDAPSNGTVRSCKAFRDGMGRVEVLTYSVEGNRYCMNIGRYHKSNGIGHHLQSRQ